ncbi:MAG: hypothetical protein WC650_01195 [Candidatus Doudnabacteria bacterium]
MKQTKLIFTGFLDAFSVAVYVVVISLILGQGEKIFGKMDNFLGPVALLLLLVLSAAITGALTLGRPILLYLQGCKREAIGLFLYTLGWLFLMTLLVFILQVLK